MNNPKHNPLSPVHDPANAKAKCIEDAKMKNDIMSPSTEPEFKLGLDKSDPRAPYRIYYLEAGVWTPITRIFKLCDADVVRRLGDVIEGGQKCSHSGS